MLRLLWMSVGDMMNNEVRRWVGAFCGMGWHVELFQQRRQLPLPIVERYPWLPPDYLELIEEAKLISSPDEKAWFLTVADFSGESDSAFAWNEWERQSLEAADGDEAWKRRIVAYWNSHCPILMSVKSGYAYFAIEQSSMRVVAGEAPEYEECSVLASSVRELVHLITTADSRLERWL